MTKATRDNIPQYENLKLYADMESLKSVPQASMKKAKYVMSYNL